ncbi:MAG TPA: hypothetical protein VFE58_16625 [Tepidisphaeraceae bacterium]|nr:hypothetical protein [Tepidisphaeraceae bacterium]
MVRSLFVLLILAGAALGALVSMEIHARQRQAGLLADNHDLQTRLAFIEARQGDMLSFLSRPQTELVKLAGTQEWAGQELTVAWNPVQRFAVVLIDRLPSTQDGTAYHLQAVQSADAAATVELGTLNPSAADQQIYSVPTSVGNHFHFEISLGQHGANGRTVFAAVHT